MNADLLKKALDEVGNPNILVNLISRRVRQLNYGGGHINRPLMSDIGDLRTADIALREIIDGKMGWEMPEVVKLIRPVDKKRMRR